MNLVQTIAIFALPVIFAITLHEAAHGYAARHFGDVTAWRLGRISLNPIRHIDLVGTIVVPLVILMASTLMGSSGILFGWAKPVPVNFGALRNPKRDMLWVAAAGPGANLAMALMWALIMKVGLILPANAFSVPLDLMADAGIKINIVLMILNLLPILPLDGGRITVSLLPTSLAIGYSRLEPLGFPILIVLLMTRVLDSILSPLVQASIRVIETIFQL